MQAPVAVLGQGQLGSLFSSLLEAKGIVVQRLRRGDALAGVPEGVIVAVGEDDLDAALASLPVSWRDRVVLVQNELAPEMWRAHEIEPTVAVVWFEKKGDTPPRVVLPSPIAGRGAEAMASLLSESGLPAHAIAPELLPAALLDKNVYILVSNLAGLAAPPKTTTAALLELPLLERTTQIFADVLAVESARLGMEVDADTASAAMMRAFLADPDHVAAGRSAPARLRRTLARADARGIAVPALRALVTT